MGILPTVRVFGPKGLAIINLSDLEMYRAKGFKTESELQTKSPEPEPETQIEGELESMKVQELKDICADLNIQEFEGTPVANLKKAHLIAAIRPHREQPKES